MITRGIIIGKIVDDFSSLKYQIETRNRLGQFDLTKFCEDFIREVLNICFDLNLKNLNKTRSNFPGLDLGDKKNKKAYQITSQKTSAKINETLVKIIGNDKENYDHFYVFIVGEKQTSYTIDVDNAKEINFTHEENVFDIDDILQKIVVLDIQKLESLYTLFVREFRQVKIELEPLDENGNFESSYFNYLEKKPSSPPLNAVKFLECSIEDAGYKDAFQDVLNIYENLSYVPRVTRELIAIIVDKGVKKDANFNDDGKIKILPQSLEKFLNLSEREVLVEINILENAKLVELDEDEVGERPQYFIKIKDEMLNHLLYWFIDKGISIRTVFNTMDFTILDE